MNAYYYFLPVVILWEFICMFNGKYFDAVRSRLKERIRCNMELRKEGKPLVANSPGEIAFMLFDVMYFYWAWFGLLTAQWPFFLALVLLSIIFIGSNRRYSLADAILSFLVLVCMAANLHLWEINFGGILALLFGR
jgi:hypothetical protein